MRRVTPVPREDLWVYPPENLAAVQRGLEDVRAGRLIRMSPDELVRYGDAVEAARAAGEPLPEPPQPAPRAG